MDEQPERTDPDAIRRWRRETRERLIAARLELPQAVRAQKAAELTSRLGALIERQPARVVSLYWPFRGEPDLRPLGAAIERAGGRVALPVVVTPKAPLVFRPWSAGMAMTRGIWNIPVPDTAEEVVPDLLIAPVVGFDPQNYRLGYGGGYFDRTLARLGAAARVIGVGYGMQALETIYPQPHDMPMTRIITA